MKIGIIDADLIGRAKHRFPNLACEKISAYHKENSDSVNLLLSYDDMGGYDIVYISKVFTDTPIPDWLVSYVEGEYPGESYISFKPDWVGKNKPIINLGGTGFYFDKAPNLPDYIEHHMPDYHLYDDFIEQEVEKARLEKGESFRETYYRSQFKEYTDYSIGFLTRGCFRKCKFCVNQKYDHVFCHSSLEEFYDPSRKKICFLDDNFLGYPHWEKAISDVLKTGKQFKFKQGLDERLLTDKKCKMLFSSKYDGDLTFAFDNISDYALIHKKLELISKYKKSKGVMFYVLVGFERTDEIDIENAFKRIELLFHYKCLPYIMRYMDKNNSPWKESRFRSLYVTMARWCNQPSIVKKMTFRDFCEANQALHKTDGTLCSSMKAMTEFEEEFPEIASKYFDLRFGEPNSKFIK